MSEQIKIKDITGMSFLGHAILNIMAAKGLNEFNIVPGETAAVDLDLKINGVEVSFHSFIQTLESQFDSIVDEAVGKKVLENFRDRFSSLQDILSEVERNLKIELEEKGFYRYE